MDSQNDHEQYSTNTWSDMVAVISLAMTCQLTLFT